MRTAALLIAIGWCMLAVAAVPETGMVMPAVFEQGIVFLDLPAPDQSRIRMLTGSGGGLPTLSSEAADRLNLSRQRISNAALLMRFGPNVRRAGVSRDMLQHWPVLRSSDSFVVVPGVVAVKGWPATADGTLGQTWFADHTWSWDYPRGKLILRPDNWRPAAAARRLAITFREHPSIMIGIDGAEIPALFDTGASTVLTLSAMQALDDGKPALRSSSTIAHSVIATWHARHANWRFVDDSQLGTHAPMIRVPDVLVAGLSVGPVWFTERADEFFRDFTAAMGTRVDGTIGGNALADCVVSVSYGRSRAWVQVKPSRH